MYLYYYRQGQPEDHVETWTGPEPYRAKVSGQRVYYEYGWEAAKKRQV